MCVPGQESEVNIPIVVEAVIFGAGRLYEGFIPKWMMSHGHANATRLGLWPRLCQLVKQHRSRRGDVERIESGVGGL